MRRPHYVILPDAVGAGKSSKPSDGMRTGFPRYTYDDIVLAQYRLVAEHLGVRHLQLVLGTSAGGMQTWMWGEAYPGFMDALVPLASTPSEVAGRNWMLRRMLIDAIRNDPEWNGGNYTRQPSGFRQARVYFAIANQWSARRRYMRRRPRARRPTRRSPAGWRFQASRTPMTCCTNTRRRAITTRHRRSRPSGRASSRHQHGHDDERKSGGAWHHGA